MEYQDMVVIFLDILGSKNRMDFREKYDVHQLFHSEVKLNEDRQGTLPDVVYTRRIYSFSDCAYFFYYYKDGIEEERKNDDNLIYIAAFNTSLSLLKFLSNGYLVRGGISFGEAYIDDLGFFGPAVEAAYHVEQELAKYPRMAFDEDTGRRVFSWDHKPDNISPIMLERYKRIPFLTEIEDGVYFVNTFYEMELNEHITFHDCTLDLDDIKRAVRDTVLRDRENLRDAHDLEKLDWIERYTYSKELLLDLSEGGTMISIVPRGQDFM